MKLPIMAILNWIKTNKILSLVIFILLMAGAVIFFFAKGKAKGEDCTAYKKVAEDLIEAFSGKEITFEPVHSSFTFAVFYQDTIKQKPMTKVEWERYRDSVIREAKRKLDSITKKTKS